MRTLALDSYNHHHHLAVSDHLPKTKNPPARFTQMRACATPATPATSPQVILHLHLHRRRHRPRRVEQHDPFAPLSQTTARSTPNEHASRQFDPAHTRGWSQRHLASGSSTTHQAESIPDAMLAKSSSVRRRKRARVRVQHRHVRTARARTKYQVRGVFRSAVRKYMYGK